MIRNSLRYFFFDGSLADKNKEDEAPSEKVDTADNPEDKLRGGDALHSLMVSMCEVVDTLEHPEDPHHEEQLGVQHLGRHLLICVLTFKIFQSIFGFPERSLF